MDGALVRLRGTLVGTLERLGVDQDFRLVFDASWLAAPRREVLGQVFEDRLPGPVATSGLPCWFAHLMPQGPSRRLLSRWAGIAGNDDFDLLVAIGSDLPGAVSLEPAVVDAVLRSRPARRAVQGRAGFLLAGAQYKLSARRDEGALVLPARGESGDVLAKFHDPRHRNLPRLEHATTTWARAAGINTHRCRLGQASEFAELPEGLPLGDGVVFLAERFDRSRAGPVHVEDFGQILDRPPGHPQQYHGAYEELARIVRWVCPEDAEELLRRVVFTVLSGNGDAHLKNWGVIYPDGRRAHLSPAYDLVSTVCRIRGEQLALTLGGGRDFASVRAEILVALGVQAGLDHGRARDVVAAADEQTRASWRHVREAFEPEDRERLEAHLANVRL